MQHIVIYMGDDRTFLLQCFRYLAELSKPMHLHFYAPYTLRQRADIQMNLVRVFREGHYFEKTTSEDITLNITWYHSTEPEISSDTLFIPIPDTFSLESNETLLEFSDAHIDKIEALDEAGIALDEACIQQIVDTKIATSWVPRSVWEKEVKSELLELLEAEQATAKQLEVFEVLQHAALYKHGFHFAWRKAVQEPALQLLMSQPGHEGAHLCLSLFKRYFDSFPETIAERLRFWQEQHVGYLRIQPPLEEYALTYILTTYQRIEKFKRAAQHILDQSSDNWYFTIFDHGSGPEMQACIAEIQQQRPDRIRVHREDVNTGVQAIFKHLQKVIHEAPTELVCFCADDDYVWEDHAKRSLELFEKYPWISMVYSGKQVVSNTDSPPRDVGPFYKEAQIIDPKTELQRIIPMRSATPHFVARKAVFKALGSTDPYLPADAVYGLHDTLSHIFAISLYEVACTNEILSSVTLDDSSAFMQQDISSVWLIMVQEVVQKYVELFEEDFPVQPVQQLIKMLFDTSYARLWHDFTHLNDVDTYREQLDIKTDFYREAFDFKQKVLPFCSINTPFLFDNRHPYTPL